jgi:diacylglycerol kinase (ATP)
MRHAPLHLLVNPSAGRGRAAKRLSGILQHLQQAGLKPVVHQSTGLGDIEAEAKVLAGAEGTLLVAGGDGSVHELVNGILGAGATTPFGVIPVGSGNDFAKAAEIPLDWEAATRLLADRLASNATPRPVDAGRMNGRFFANGAGIGLDATVTRRVLAYRWPGGDVLYLRALLRTLAHGVPAIRLRIRNDELLWDGPLTLANIANGAWIGGMFHIAPHAGHADGQLDLLVAAAPLKRRRVLKLLPKLVKGTHLDEPEVHHWTVTRLSVESDQPVASHLDGEVQPLTTQFEIEVLPGALRLV